MIDNIPPQIGIPIAIILWAAVCWPAVTKLIPNHRKVKK